jgi:hypothetical protein
VETETKSGRREEKIQNRDRENFEHDPMQRNTNFHFFEPNSRLPNNSQHTNEGLQMIQSIVAVDA